MPRFYFHTETDVRTTDTEGMEFPGYEEAKHEAIRTAGQLMHDTPQTFLESGPWSVSLTNAKELIILRIYLEVQISAD